MLCYVQELTINCLNFSDFGEIEIPPAPEGVATYGANDPRLMISKIVNENFKSYAGVRALGPFHKVSLLSLVFSNFQFRICLRITVLVYVFFLQSSII